MSRTSKGCTVAILTQAVVSATCVAVACIMDPSVTGWTIAGGLFISIIPGFAPTFAVLLAYTDTE